MDSALKRLPGLPVVWFLLCSMTASAQIPTNTLPLRIGDDQAGGSVFRGQIVAVRLYNRVLAATELKKLAQSPPGAESNVEGLVGQWLQPKLPVQSRGRVQCKFERGCTLEAWIRPQAGMSGRIVDKITPGGGDGFLLDTHPGDALRCIVGNDILSCPLPHTEKWTHVAATVDPTGLLAFYVNGARVAGSESELDGQAVTGAVEGPNDPLTLWYRRPAIRWTEASPIGNGRLGGMVWGGVRRERIDLNEDTLWSGEPYDNLNPKGLKSLPEIRRLLRRGQEPGGAEARRAGHERQVQPELPAARRPDDRVSVPRRSDGLPPRARPCTGRVSGAVRAEGVRYTREVFASNPAQAIVVRLDERQAGQGLVQGLARAASCITRPKPATVLSS